MSAMSDLKQGVEELRRSKTLKYVLATLLSIGNCLNNLPVSRPSLVVLGTGTGTCEKVLVAKTLSFSAVIDTLWHLYSETLSVYWFLCPSFTVLHYLADLHFISFF